MSAGRVGFGNRLAALQAMAGQDASPHEAAVAREKLRRLQRRQDRDESWRAAWADQKEHERIADLRAQAAREAEIAAIVRRWEHGTFSGLSVSVGATAPQKKFATPEGGG